MRQCLSYFIVMSLLVATTGCGRSQREQELQAEVAKQAKVKAELREAAAKEKAQAIAQMKMSNQQLEDAKNLLADATALKQTALNETQNLSLIHI